MMVTGNFGGVWTGWRSRAVYVSDWTESESGVSKREGDPIGDSCSWNRMRGDIQKGRGTHH